MSNYYFIAYSAKILLQSIACSSFSLLINFYKVNDDNGAIAK